MTTKLEHVTLSGARATLWDAGRLQGQVEALSDVQINLQQAAKIAQTAGPALDGGAALLRKMANEVGAQATRTRAASSRQLSNAIVQIANEPDIRPGRWARIVAALRAAW